jgi:hypothetical protein
LYQTEGATPSRRGFRRRAARDDSPVTTEPEPTDDEAAAPQERHEEEDAMRYPGHERPEDAREDAGLDDPRRSRPR